MNVTSHNLFLSVKTRVINLIIWNIFFHAAKISTNTELSTFDCISTKYVHHVSGFILPWSIYLIRDKRLNITTSKIKSIAFAKSCLLIARITDYIKTLVPYFTWLLWFIMFSFIRSTMHNLCLVSSTVYQITYFFLSNICLTRIFNNTARKQN